MKRSFFLALLLGYLTAHAGNIGRITVFTTLHSARIDAAFDTLPSANAVFRVLLMDDRTGKLIVDRKITGTATGHTLQFHLDGLDVDAWTPLNPHLYRIALSLTQPGQATQQQEKRIGFRLFESRNGRLYLNGHPIFLRGIAINPPDRGIPDSVEKSRCFAEQYVDFMKSIHVNIIRIPSNETWYDVCDEKGMMVFGGNYSGTVDGQKPPKDYEKAIRWYEDKTFAMIASQPSLMVYAMTNETPFAGKTVAEWEKFLSFAATRLRLWDITRVLPGVTHPQIKAIAALFEAQPPWRRHIGLDLLCCRSLLIAKLERRQSVSMQRNVGVGRIRVQTLPDHQHGFPMIVSTVARQRDIRRQAGVLR